MAVDPGFAIALRDPATYKTVTNAGLPAGILPTAIETEIVSAFWTESAAGTEATRQLDFLGGPNVVDLALVAGQRIDLIGRPITLVGDRLGYAGAGKTVFVIGVQEQENDVTLLTVLRKTT